MSPVQASDGPGTQRTWGRQGATRARSRSWPKGGSTRRFGALRVGQERIQDGILQTQIT